MYSTEHIMFWMGFGILFLYKKIETISLLSKSKIDVEVGILYVVKIH